MLIADAQVHVWDADRPERPWPRQEGDLPRPHREQAFTPARLLQEMDAAGVARAVLVSPSFEGTRNDVVCAAAREHPDRFTVMARFEPLAVDGREFMSACRRLPGVRGVRLSFHRRESRALLLSADIDWLWREAEALQLPVMALVRQRDMPRIGEIAARHPHLKLTLDHLGLTEGVDEAAFGGLDHLLALAKHPHVCVKASCLPLFTADSYPFPRLHAPIRRVYDAFGAQRMFWGSDLSRLPCPYQQGVALFTETLPWLTGRDLALVMGEALCQWLDWRRV